MLFNSALLLCLIHGYRYSPPRYLVTCLRYRYPPRSTEHIPPVSHLSCATDPVTLSLSLQSFRRFRQESTLSPRHLSFPSYPLALILSLFIFVVVLYIHVTNRSIKPHRSSAPREGVLS